MNASVRVTYCVKDDCIHEVDEIEVSNEPRVILLANKGKLQCVQGIMYDGGLGRSVPVALIPCLCMEHLEGFLHDMTLAEFRDHVRNSGHAYGSTASINAAVSFSSRDVQGMFGKNALLTLADLIIRSASRVAAKDLANYRQR